MGARCSLASPAPSRTPAHSQQVALIRSIDPPTTAVADLLLRLRRPLPCTSPLFVSRPSVFLVRMPPGVAVAAAFLVSD